MNASFYRLYAIIIISLIVVFVTLGFKESESLGLFQLTILLVVIVFIVAKHAKYRTFKNIISDKVMFYAVLAIVFVYVNQIEFVKRSHKNLDDLLETEIKAEIVKVSVSRSFVNLQLSNHKPISFGTSRSLWFSNNETVGDSIFKVSGTDKISVKHNGVIIDFEIYKPYHYK